MFKLFYFLLRAGKFMKQGSGKINSHAISLTPNAVWITVLVFLSLVLLATPASQVYNTSSDEVFFAERYEAHIVQTMNSSVLQKGAPRRCLSRIWRGSLVKIGLLTHLPHPR